MQHPNYPATDCHQARQIVPGDQPEFYTLEEAARKVNLKIWQLRHSVRHRNCRSYRLNNRIFIRPKDLYSYLKLRRAGESFTWR